MPQAYPMWSGAFWNLNERERREKKVEEEALMRELTKLAAEAGYRKEEAEMRENRADTRFDRGQKGEETRLDRQLSHAEKLDQMRKDAALVQHILERQANLSELGMKYVAEDQLAENAFNRGKPIEERKLTVAEQRAAADTVNAASIWLNANGEITDADRSFLKFPNLSTPPPRTTTLPSGAARRGRFSVSKPDGTPPKSGETPRTPNNAAPPLPVQVGPKPLDSGVSIIGGDKATLQGGPNIAQPTLSELMKQSAPPQWPYNTLAIDVGQPRTAKQPSLYQQLRNALPEELSGLLPENGVDALPSIKRDKAGELVEKYLLRQPAIKK